MSSASMKLLFAITILTCSGIPVLTSPSPASHFALAGEPGSMAERRSQSNMKVAAAPPITSGLGNTLPAPTPVEAAGIQALEPFLPRVRYQPPPPSPIFPPPFPLSFPLPPIFSRFLFPVSTFFLSLIVLTSSPSPPTGREAERCVWDARKNRAHATWLQHLHLGSESVEASKQ